MQPKLCGRADGLTSASCTQVLLYAATSGLPLTDGRGPWGALAARVDRRILHACSLWTWYCRCKEGSSGIRRHRGWRCGSCIRTGAGGGARARATPGHTTAHAFTAWSVVRQAVGDALSYALCSPSSHPAASCHTWEHHPHARMGEPLHAWKQQAAMLAFWAIPPPPATSSSPPAPNVLELLYFVTR